MAFNRLWSLQLHLSASSTAECDTSATYLDCVSIDYIALSTIYNLYVDSTTDT